MRKCPLSRHLSYNCHSYAWTPTKPAPRMDAGYIRVGVRVRPPRPAEAADGMVVDEEEATISMEVAFQQVTFAFSSVHASQDNAALHAGGEDGGVYERKKGGIA